MRDSRRAYVIYCHANKAFLKSVCPIEGSKWTKHIGLAHLFFTKNEAGDARSFSYKKTRKKYKCCELVPVTVNIS